MKNTWEVSLMNHQYYIDTDEDPRNDEDFDTWAYGTEPLPKDTTWSHHELDPPCCADPSRPC